MKKLIALALLGGFMASCTVVSPVTATNNPIGDKVGKSETGCIFYIGGLSSGIVMNKNYGIVEAAQNGGITKIATVDVSTTNYIIFTKKTLIVTGE